MNRRSGIMDLESGRTAVLERWKDTRSSGISVLELTFWNNGITKQQAMTRLRRKRIGVIGRCWRVLESIVDRMLTGKGLQLF